MRTSVLALIRLNLTPLLVYRSGFINLSRVDSSSEANLFEWFDTLSQLLVVFGFSNGRSINFVILGGYAVVARIEPTTLLVTETTEPM